jgi:hypothetical protein
VTALVVILICAGDMPRESCTRQTARAVLSTRLEQPVCGVGVIAATGAAAHLAADEFARIRCTMK